MKRILKLRRASDGGNILIVAIAIGVISLIGMYIFSKDMIGSTASSQKNMTSAIEQGLLELKK